MLQQCLPLTVLKLAFCYFILVVTFQLQQCLPLTVLKPDLVNSPQLAFASVATVLTAYGIETIRNKEFASLSFLLQQCLPLTVLKLK